MTSTFHGPQALVLIRQGPAQEDENLCFLEGLEDEDPGPGQQRPDDFEIGVFGGGPDEGDEPFLHVGQQGVLLGLVEAVDFVDEEDGAAAPAPARAGPPPPPGAGPATPDMTALRLKNSASMVRAITRARVVLPLPGGPQKIMEEKRRLAFRARHKRRPGPTRCSWPTNSLRLRGRNRAARGDGGANNEAVLSMGKLSRSAVSFQLKE